MEKCVSVIQLNEQQPLRPSVQLTGRLIRIKSQPSNIFEAADPIINAKPRTRGEIERNNVNGFKPTWLKITQIKIV